MPRGLLCAEAAMSELLWRDILRPDEPWAEFFSTKGEVGDDEVGDDGASGTISMEHFLPETWPDSFRHEDVADGASGTPSIENFRPGTWPHFLRPEDVQASGRPSIENFRPGTWPHSLRLEDEAGAAPGRLGAAANSVDILRNELLARAHRRPSGTGPVVCTVSNGSRSCWSAVAPGAPSTESLRPVNENLLSPLGREHLRPCSLRFWATSSLKPLFCSAVSATVHKRPRGSEAPVPRGAKSGIERVDIFRPGIEAVDIFRPGIDAVDILRALAERVDKLASDTTVFFCFGLPGLPELPTSGADVSRRPAMPPPRLWTEHLRPVKAPPMLWTESLRPAKADDVLWIEHLRPAPGEAIRSRDGARAPMAAQDDEAAVTDAPTPDVALFKIAPFNEPADTKQNQCVSRAQRRMVRGRSALRAFLHFCEKRSPLGASVAACFTFFTFPLSRTRHLSSAGWIIADFPDSANSAY
eukprot:782297-Prymnesium_polylepis.5